MKRRYNLICGAWVKVWNWINWWPKLGCNNAQKATFLLRLTRRSIKNYFLILFYFYKVQLILKLIFTAISYYMTIVFVFVLSKQINKFTNMKNWSHHQKAKPNEKATQNQKSEVLSAIPLNFQVFWTSYSRQLVRDCLVLRSLKHR
jgi:hypothetical protein